MALQNDILSTRKTPPSAMPNPFRTFAEWIYPRSMTDVFIWAAFLWERNPKYRTCIQRVVSYFLAGVKVKQDGGTDKVDSKTQDEFSDLLDDTYDLIEICQQFGEELAGMGNVFVSVDRIFSRELLCPTEGCGWQMHLKGLRKGVEYDWDGAHFTGVCPRCGQKVQWKIKDVKADDPDGTKLRFVFRSAEDMRVQYNRLTNTYKYLYKVPSDVMDAIKRGDSVYLEDSPQVFLDAAATNEPFVEFPEENFFAMRTHTLSALDKYYKGWGAPLFLVAFDNIVRLQHLNKFNEVVLFNYIIPTQIISPRPENLQAGLTDPNRMPLSGFAFRSFMSQAFRHVKTNPSQTIISPVSVEYTRVGGDKDCIPADLMEYEMTQFLADTGIPQEFKSTTFQAVAPSMGLRMFEKEWIRFAKSMNKFVKWASMHIARAHNYENMVASLDTTSFVEDDMNKQIQLTLMQGQLIAKTPVLKRYGVDFDEDLKQRMQEQQAEQDAGINLQQTQENAEMVGSVVPPGAAPGIGQAQANIDAMQQQAQGQPAQPGMPAQPAMPAPPAGAAGAPQMAMPFNEGNSPSAAGEQLFEQANQIAQQLYNAPEAVRRSELAKLKSTNWQLHAQVTQMLKDMRQQVASEAVMQSQQPQG